MWRYCRLLCNRIAVSARCTSAETSSFPKRLHHLLSPPAHETDARDTSRGERPLCQNVTRTAEGQKGPWGPCVPLRGRGRAAGRCFVSRARSAPLAPRPPPPQTSGFRPPHGRLCPVARGDRLLAGSGSRATQTPGQGAGRHVCPPRGSRFSGRWCPGRRQADAPGARAPACGARAGGTNRGPGAGTLTRRLLSASRP